MDEFTYCKTICGAKCCNYKGITCPHLQPDNSCDCYEERFQEGNPDIMGVALIQIGEHKAVINCGRILHLIETGILPAEIAAQCCVVHPELLKGTI